MIAKTSPVSFENGINEMRSMLQFLRTTAKADPDTTSEDGDELEQFAFVLETVLMIMLRRHPVDEFERLDVARTLIPGLLLTLVEEERDALISASHIDLASPKGNVQMLLSILVNAGSIISKRLHSYQYRPLSELRSPGAGDIRKP